jgi:hypothetical protein
MRRVGYVLLGALNTRAGRLPRRGGQQVLAAMGTCGTASKVRNVIAGSYCLSRDGVPVG